MAAPPTRLTLIQRIRNPEDAKAWEEFVEIYAPIIFNFAKSKGLQEADAADITQDVMRNVSKAMARFEKREGVKFRSWLYQIARNELNNFSRKKIRRPQGDGRTTMMAVAEAQHDDSIEADRWDQEYRRQIFEWAAAAVRSEFNPRIWEAFWRTAVLDQDSKLVGQDLEMSRASVYVAKSRCLKRLQEKISNAGDQWENDNLPNFG